MQNIQFTHEGQNYSVEFTNGRPDQCVIKGPLANNTKVVTFKRLTIDVAKTSQNFIRTTYMVDAEDSEGRRLKPDGIYKSDEPYNTLQPLIEDPENPSNYELYIQVLGPILMPLLVNNMCESEGITKPYSPQKIGQIIQGLQALAAQLNV